MATGIPVDAGGNDLIINNLYTGATGPGQSGTLLAGAASVATLSGAQTVTGVKTFSANPAFTVGNTIKSNVAAATLTSNAATVTSYFVQGTTPALTTAAGASQAEVITLTGVAAGDIAFVQWAGGTNTVAAMEFLAVCTTNTVTVTIYNTGPTSALNGTVIFNLWVLKA
jgi:hypothetical protein